MATNEEKKADAATTGTETFEFQTEAWQILDLMINSVYSNKEIFLRELISNASDALDKLRFESQTNADLTKFTADPYIRLSRDMEARTLSVTDNGIGMNREDLTKFLGTIAKSGTKEFLANVQAARESGTADNVDLIGQFGVGFYAAFMVADEIEVVSRRAGEDKAWLWKSTGDGTYSIAEAERAEPGTTVTLKLKPMTEANGMEDYTQDWTLREIVKKYSDFVGYPIRMEVTRTEYDYDDQGKRIEGTEHAKTTDETLNSMKAIWMREDKDVTEEEHKDFYRHISHDWHDPMKHILQKAEGMHEFRALLYLPSEPQQDLFFRDSTSVGVSLYIRRVFIMNDCKDLIPEYLRFVRGVVDSEDLSLNLSREMLQKDAQIAAIRKGVTKKLFDTFKQMMKKEPDTYFDFWKKFGKLIKEGLFLDHDNMDELFKFCLLPTTRRAAEDDKDAAPWEKAGFTTLDDYVARMKPEQKDIYYITGKTPAAVAESPHLEALKSREIECLLLSDHVDEVWTGAAHEYKEHHFRNASKGELELGTEEERKKEKEELDKASEAAKPLFEALAKPLGENIKEVRYGARLTDSAACLVGETWDATPQLEAMMRAMGQEVPKTKRTLELNPNHPVVKKMSELFASNADDPRLADYAQILYGQAILAEGQPLDNPAEFNKALAELLK
ncbi:molecular chaperone HtpG [Candidatus Sumerlaeota bacterium]|nr:molecular chaperone HtpG [Candidatus Sumerlaeota bacterium]